MPGYVIAEVTVTDPQGFEKYREMVPATLARWWASEEHREAKALRQKTARTDLVIVEGA